MLMLAGMAWTLAAGASELSELKAKGLVGERVDGYVGLVQADVTEAVRSQVAEINAKREAAYQRIAVQNNISPEDVARLAGRKTIEKTVPGHWIYVDSWRRK